MNLSVVILLVLLAAIAAFYVGWLLRDKIGRDKIANVKRTTEQLLSEARNEADSLKKEKLLEAEEHIFHLRQKLEQQEKEKLGNLRKFEQQLSTREVNLDRKVDILNKKEKQLVQQDQSFKAREKKLQIKEQELERLFDEQNRKLEQISGITSEEARKIQMDNILESSRQEAASLIKDIKDRARLTANQQAKQIIIQAIQRAAISHVVETTVSIVNLPNDDMKGRIIGREGRNIRTFEAATGIEVLIDDTPEVVMLSGFDPVRREIAKLSLEKLIYDGRIHPGRIEEVVQKTREEIDEKTFESGEQAVLEVGLHGIHHELVKLLGSLKFHTSQGQNLLQHAIEVSLLAGLMAAELELDVHVAHRAALLHEVGCAVQNYTMGSSAELSADLAKKYGETEQVQEAIRYSNSLEISNNTVSPTTVLVATANEISRTRPGAQKEMLQSFFKRLHSLEDIANSFIGVTNSYAIQAGREIRVMVEHSNVDDAKAEQIAAAIAKRIHSTLTYPGQIKVTVIREYRKVDFAR